MDFSKIYNESNDDFEYMEQAVKQTYGSCYSQSSAFQKALEYIKSHDFEMYKSLIKEEYEDMGEPEL